MTPGVLRRAERHLTGADPVMAALVERVGRCGLGEVQRSRPFPALVESIVHQQLSLPAARTIHGRFLELYDGRPPSARRLLETPEEKLRAVGLSGAKVRYLRDLAERVSARRLPLGRLDELDDEEVIEVLTEVKGIGRWTAQMFLIFRLGRLDVLPVDDLGVRDAMRQAYDLEELPEAARMEEIAAPWRPYRSVGCWYLWRTRRTGGLGPEAEAR